MQYLLNLKTCIILLPMTALGFLSCPDSIVMHSTPNANYQLQGNVINQAGNHINAILFIPVEKDLEYKLTPYQEVSKVIAENKGIFNSSEYTCVTKMNTFLPVTIKIPFKTYLS